MRAVDYLQELIPFPSVSTESNRAISDCVEVWLKKLDFETELLQYPDDRGVQKCCVVARKGPSTGSGLAYFGHTDVVPVNSWSFSAADPWTPHISDGRLYGRGSCDMRGSLACMLAAAEALQHTRLTAPVYYVATADEEIGMAGAARVVQSSEIYREIVRGQANSIIGEPTLLEVVHAHKGGRAIKATSIGRAAHSSMGVGINANMALIPFLSEIGRIHEEMETSATWQDKRFSPSSPTLNIVIKDTNTGINITSAQSECHAYFRPMPGQNADAMVERMRALAIQHGLKFDVLFSGEPLYTDPSNPFVQELLTLTSHSAPRTVAYGTDGAIFTELKNIVVFGPGDIAQAHTDDEWISLDQLQRGTDLYEQCVRRWCC
ncbi:MAG: acetylornithine deacetylase [Planctomycetota bacterium]|jgi:acetylornithine deacetylase|nr:MAG: acetylornithine deacetylase [Planctomycetota bacterium]